MKAKCFDCERTVRGCRVVVSVCKPYVYDGKLVDLSRWIGLYICRKCYTLERLCGTLRVSIKKGGVV
jgi:hypothetical protein